MQDTLILPHDELVEFPVGHASFITGPDDLARPISALTVRRILVPFDLSRSSGNALRTVANFAAKKGASIHLLHVVRPGEDPGLETMSSCSDDNMAEAAQRLLKHWIKKVVPDHLRTFVSVRIGQPVELIVARAIAVRADLIVMTTRSCSGQELQRSTAERISRMAPCPVLTIPEKYAEQWAYSPDKSFSENWRTVLMPVDFSTAAEVAVSYASVIASKKGAKLLLAHGADVDHSEVHDVHARIRTWARERLDNATHFSTVVWPGGHSLFAILAEAIRAAATLIVLPTCAQPWAQRLRAGSITDGVLRQAGCPILSINENVSILKQ